MHPVPNWHLSVVWLLGPMNSQWPRLCRDAWASMLFITNILGQVPIGGHTWNIPLQMQFYAVLPLALWALHPRLAGFRSRLAYSCLACVILSSLYQAWVVLGQKLTWPIPEQAAFNQGASAGHDPEAVRMARTYFSLLYMSFIARMTDFAAGVLVYIVLTSPAATNYLKAYHRMCSLISTVILAILAYVCLGGRVALKPTVDPSASLILRIGMLVAAKGLCCPMSTAWLLLHLMLQLDVATRHLVRFLSSPKWNTMAKQSYSVFLWHPLVLVWVFQVVDTISLIGPLHDFPTYVLLCFTTLVLSFGVASIQDAIGDMSGHLLPSWTLAHPNLAKIGHQNTRDH